MAAHRRIGRLPATVFLAASVLLGGCSLSNVGLGGPTPADAIAPTAAQSAAAAAAAERLTQSVIADLRINADILDEMDPRDRQAAAKAQIDALEISRTGAPVTWRNPETDAHGLVVPGATYVVNNQECRDYHHTLFVGDLTQDLSGTECRQPDGTWKPLV